MFGRIGNLCVFSKLNLKTGANQIRLKRQGVKKTALNTRYKKYEYLVLPLSLFNAPATFDSLMDEMFKEFIRVVYMDDLFLFSNDIENHYRRAKAVLPHLRKNMLYLSPKKCENVKEEIKFLVRITGKTVIIMNLTKIDVLETWPKPNSMTDVKSFIVLLQFHP